MTLKDKALDLIWYFYNRLEHTLNEEYDKYGWKISKMCATKVADELIKETGKKYWYDVKQEIEDI